MGAIPGALASAIQPEVIANAIHPGTVANMIRGSVLLVAGVITNSEDVMSLGRRLAGGQSQASTSSRQPSPEEVDAMHEELEKWKRELTRLKNEPPDPDTLVQREEELKEIEEKHRLLEEELWNYPRPAFLGESALPGTVNVAVVGNSGVGKSLLINSLRDVQKGDPTWAPVGVNQTTTDPVAYPMPGAPGVKLWDLAGAGGQTFPRGAYTRNIGLRHFDVVLVVTTCRFTATEAALLAELASVSTAPTFVVRTMVDIDITSNLEDHNQSELETKRGILEDLRVRGVLDPYLVNARAPGAHDFPRLREDILKAARGESRAEPARGKEVGHGSSPAQPQLKFDIGEEAEVWSPDLKIFVKCIIEGVSESGGEYTVAIPSLPESIRSIPRVPAAALRKAQAFAVGEEAEIIILQGPRAGSWIRCQVESEGSSRDLYNVRIPGAPQGKQCPRNVPTSVLRKLIKTSEEYVEMTLDLLKEVLQAFKELCSSDEFQATVQSLKEMGTHREDVRRMKKTFVFQQLVSVLARFDLTRGDREQAWSRFMAFTRDQGKDPEVAALAHEVERLMLVRVGDFFQIEVTPTELATKPLRQRVEDFVGGLYLQVVHRSHQAAQAQAGLGAPMSRMQRATANHVDPMSRSMYSMLPGRHWVR